MSVFLWGLVMGYCGTEAVDEWRESRYQRALAWALGAVAVVAWVLFINWPR